MSTLLTSEQIEALEALEAKATPGPWNDFKPRYDAGGDYIRLYREGESDGMKLTDHDLCVLARNNLKPLLAMARDSIKLREANSLNARLLGEALERECALEDKNQKLREALEYYASMNGNKDCRAKEALAQEELHNG